MEAAGQEAGAAGGTPRGEGRRHVASRDAASGWDRWPESGPTTKELGRPDPIEHGQVRTGVDGGRCRGLLGEKRSRRHALAGGTPAGGPAPARGVHRRRRRAGGPDASSSSALAGWRRSSFFGRADERSSFFFAAGGSKSGANAVHLGKLRVHLESFSLFGALSPEF